MSETTSVQPHIFFHESGVACGCKNCGKIHHSGTFVPGLLITEEGVLYQYLLGFDPLIECCGEKKIDFFRTYKTKEEALDILEKVIQTLEKEGSTESLTLLQFAFGSSEAN